MRIRSLFIILFLGVTFRGLSQYNNSPVEWQFSSKKMGANKYEIHVKALIENGWHIYSQNSDKGIVQPTNIFFNPNPLLLINDSQSDEQGDVIQEEQKATGGVLRYYENEVNFTKIVTLKAHVKTNVTGTIKFMACTNEKCLPPAEKKFSIPLQ